MSTCLGLKVKSGSFESSTANCNAFINDRKLSAISTLADHGVSTVQMRLCFASKITSMTTIIELKTRNHRTLARSNLEKESGSPEKKYAN